jgi:hypothetical protein
VYRLMALILLGAGHADRRQQRTGSQGFQWEKYLFGLGQQCDLLLTDVADRHTRPLGAPEIFYVPAESLTNEI